MLFLAPAIGMNRLTGRELFGHLEADLLLDDFSESNVRSALICCLTNQRLADGPATGVELADTTRNQIDENVGIANLQ